MSSMFEDVTLFQVEVLGELAANPATLHPVHLRKEGLKGLHEELEEYEQAVQELNLVDAADALIDLIYFALGELYKMGVDADIIWRFVHEANMKKRRGITKRGNAVDAVKPDNWVDPKMLITEYLLGLKAMYRAEDQK